MVSRIKGPSNIERFLKYHRIENIPTELLLSHATLEVYRETPRLENPSRYSVPFVNIGFIGSAFEDLAVSTVVNQLKATAKFTGYEVARYPDRVLVVGGACPDMSFPSMAASFAKSRDPNITVLGISPWSSLENAVKADAMNAKRYERLREIHDMVLFTGYDLVMNDRRQMFAPRDLINMLSIDAAIAARGAYGTNDEISTLLELGKPVGLIRGTEGVTDEYLPIIRAAHRDGKDYEVVFYNSSAAEITRRVIAQAEIDRYIRTVYDDLLHGRKPKKHMTAVDVYEHLDGRCEIGDVANPWKMQVSEEELEKGWQRARDRKLWTKWYNRFELDPTGKAVLRVPREEVVEYLREATHGKMIIAEPRAGEAGVLVFPRGGRYDLAGILAEHKDNVYARKIA